MGKNKMSNEEKMFQNIDKDMPRFPSQGVNDAKVVPLVSCPRNRQNSRE